MGERFYLAVDAGAAARLAGRAFDSLLKELGPALPPSCELHHVGASAVPGCLTKGDLDINVRVDPGEFAATDAILARRFERNPGSVRDEQFSAFVCEDRELPIGIQLSARGGTYDIFVPFVVALRNEQALVKRYNALKRRFQGRSMAEYREAKSRFIQDVLGLERP